MPFASFPRPAAEGMRLCRSVRFRTAAMLLAAALLLFPSLSRADGDRPLMPDWLKLSGSLQTTYRQSPYKATPLSAAQRFRLEANINQDSWIRGYVSGHVDADLSVPGRRDSEEHIVTPELGEAYVTLDSRYLDLIIGMQQIRWGEADSLSTFDIINPVDFRNPIATARSSQRLSVGAVDLRANLDGACSTLCSSPSPVSAACPNTDRPGKTARCGPCASTPVRVSSAASVRTALSSRKRQRGSNFSARAMTWLSFFTGATSTSLSTRPVWTGSACRPW